MARSRRRTSQPLDRWASVAMAALVIAIGLLLLLGDYASARVRSFSWAERQIGADDAAFILTFSHPMDPGSVETNLKIEPPLPGRFSWAGRRMAYTLDAPAPYGERFSLTLPEAQDRFASAQQPTQFDSYSSGFQTRHRAFAYIAAGEGEQDRLVLQDLTAGERRVLTPEDLVVLDFEPYPLGDQILISAVDRPSYEAGELAPQLYAVTTGLAANPPIQPGERRRRRHDSAPPGEITLLLDNQDYQNLKFDLSGNGEVIVVQRVNRDDPGDFGPWIVRNGEARPLETEPGGDFLIAPDSASLLLLQGEGTAIIPLDEAEADASGQPLDFLPEFGRVFDLKNDGTAAAMVNFNQDDPEQRFTESLFLVDNQGNEQELLRASGSVLDAQFDPTGQILYTLTSEVVPGDVYLEQPLLSSVDLETGTVSDWLLLPPQQSPTLSLSPDGIALLLNLTALQADTETAPDTGPTQVWLLPLFPTTADRLAGNPNPTDPENLPVAGSNATWLP